MLHISWGIRPSFQKSNSYQQRKSYDYNCPTLCSELCIRVLSLDSSEMELHSYATMWSFTCFTQRMALLLSLAFFSLVHYAMQYYLGILLPEPHPYHTQNVFKYKSLPVMTICWSHQQSRPTFVAQGILNFA